MAISPAALAIIGAVGTLASVGGAIYQGIRQSEAEDYNAQVAATQAAQAQAAADVEAEDRRRRARYLLGTQLASAGASGVALEGSPLLVMVDSAVQEDLEARRIKYRGYLQSSGYRSQEALAKSASSNYLTSGFIGAGTSLLRGASQVGGQYYASTKGK